MGFDLVRFLSDEGLLIQEYRPQVDANTLIHAYKIMSLVRHIDERMIILQRQGVISFALSSRGEECCAVASAAALESSDWMYPQYREAGVMFWRGATVQSYIHQMFGNAEDKTLGRQMPNHFGDRSLNVVTVSSPIGTNIPHAAGCAYAMKIQKEKNIAIAYFGDGASSEGDFHVALSFAAVRKAPCIFFCRNNGYAISTPVKYQFATDGVAPQGPGHGVKTFRVDGNDFFAVYEVVRNARQHCINEEGPVLIEAMTYRLGAHSTSDDPTRYRDENESQAWEGKCPILRLRLYLEHEGLWNETKQVELETQIKIEVDKAIEIAKRTPPPPVESLITDVYAQPTEELKQQLDSVKRFFTENPHG